MRVIILGCGPAGLLAAHAAEQAGAESITIFSKKRKSEMYGCQYLHSDIPGLDLGQPLEVFYYLLGSPGEYRAKIYGPNSTVEVSPDTLDEDHLAWDIRKAYDRLWAKWGREVIDVSLNADNVAQMVADMPGDGFIFSTVPARYLCKHPDRHGFRSEYVWAVGDAPERGIFAPRLEQVDPGSVVCNGREAPRWYRASDVFDYRTVEWPDGVKPPFEGVTRIEKPLDTNCDCYPQVHRLGRFGKWKKGVLSDSAYHEAFKILNNEPARLF